MINWDKPIRTEYNNSAEVLCVFEHRGETIRIIRVTYSDGRDFTLARNDANQHVQLGPNSAYASALEIENVPQREHRAIYGDGSIDEDWCYEHEKDPSEENVFGYLYKENDRIWVESV